MRPVSYCMRPWPASRLTLVRCISDDGPPSGPAIISSSGKGSCHHESKRPPFGCGHFGRFSLARTSFACTRPNVTKTSAFRFSIPRRLVQNPFVGRTFHAEENRVRRSDADPASSCPIRRHLVAQETVPPLGPVRDAVWISHPYNLRRASWKLFQLEACHRTGMQCPSYVVSNDVKVLRVFARAHTYCSTKAVCMS